MISDDLLDDLRHDLCTKTGQQWARVTSGSMRPVIRPGDVVAIKSVAVDQVRVGDVIAFRSAGQSVVHRVIDKRHQDEGLVFLEKGDANLTGGGVSATDVLGVVTHIRRGDRTIPVVPARHRPLQPVVACFITGAVILKSGGERLSRMLARLWRKLVDR